jgi:signal transduction histidine kinase
MNILGNAIDAIPDKGDIWISTRSFDGWVEIKIKDNGKGIPSETREKIFDPFFTTKEIGKGTGLGLSISYGIIQKHGGKIQVESELRIGTTFTIQIPTQMSEVEHL